MRCDAAIPKRRKTSYVLGTQRKIPVLHIVSPAKILAARRAISAAASVV